MAGFQIISDISDKGCKRIPISSVTVVLNDLYELVSGATAWTAVTSTSTYFSRKAIAMEAASSSATSVLAVELDGTEKVRAESANTANAAHNGDAMVATDENTVNNTGTTSITEYAIFVQDGIGPGAKEIVGRVIVGSGINPDATT